MDRVFISLNQSELEAGEIVLPKDESRHLVQVRRHREGDTVEVLNGSGWRGEGILLKADPKGAILKLHKLTFKERTGPRLHFAMAMPKSGTFEPILQKATELGVCRILPMITDHTEGMRKSDKLDRKMERWRQILVEAVKQSGNPYLPEITSPLSLDQVLGDSEGFHRMVLALTDEAIPMKRFLLEKGSELKDDCYVFMGPEGDFSDREYQQFRKTGADFISLGPLVLRMETAAIAGIANLQSWLIGDCIL